MSGTDDPRSSLESLHVAATGSWPKVSPATQTRDRRVTDPAGPAEPTPANPGERLGRYTLRREIGRGGMGVVYEADDPFLERPIALKVLRQGREATASQIQRFMDEARAVSSLDHPNIVAVHDMGQAEGRLFFAMDLVRGRSLDSILEAEGPLSPHRAFEIMLGVVQALEHAHACGVIHRDVKPGNILVEEGDRVHLADFGLASHPRREVKVTESGTFVGTLAYASPERLAFMPGDARSDLYSVGVALYEVMTGRRPFQWLEDSLSRLSHAIHNDLPVPLRQVRPEISPEAERICLKCLDPSPSHRYQTGAELAGDMARFLAGEQVLARAIGWRRLAIRARRHWPALAVGLVAGLTVVSLALGAAHSDAKTRLDIADQRRDALGELAASLSLDEQLAAITSALAIDPTYWEGRAERARILRRVAAARRRAGDPAGARRAALDARAEIARAIAESDEHRSRVPLTLLDAEICRRQLRNPELTTDAFENLARTTPDTAVGAYARARLAQVRGDSARARREVHEALRELPGLAPARFLAGELALEGGDPRVCLAELDEATAAWDLHDDGEPFTLRARALESLGDRDGARVELDHALRHDPFDEGARAWRKRLVEHRASSPASAPSEPVN